MRVGVGGHFPAPEHQAKEYDRWESAETGKYLSEMGARRTLAGERVCTMDGDGQLLERWVRGRDQGSFRELVGRHVDLVYGAARRMLGGPGREAEDVTQAVFLLLAQKAARIPAGRGHGALAGWLYRTTQYCCANVRKEEGRRKKREREAAMRKSEVSAGGASGEELGTILDEALGRLGEKERQAILVRYLEGKTTAETGNVLGISAEAVEKRLERGIGKLRVVFGQKGYVVPAAGLVTLMAAESVQAAPMGVSASAAGVTSSASTAATGIAKGAAAMMKLAIYKMVALGACVILVLGVGVVQSQRSGTETPAVPAETHPVMTATVGGPRERAKTTYRAVVLDEQGKPVAGAKVRLERTDWDRKGMRVEVDAVTGADGRFVLGPVEQAAVPELTWRTITVDAPGFGWGWWDGTTDTFDENAVGEIRLAPAEQVAGTVVDAQGKAVVGAAVGLTLQDYGGLGYGEENGRGAKTDGAGRFVIERVPAGTRAYIRVVCPGFIDFKGDPSGEPPVIAGALDLRLTLVQGARVTVQLVRGEMPYAKAGAMVRAYEAGRLAGLVLTDERGVAVFGGLAPGKHTFRADGMVLSADGLVGREMEVETKAGEAKEICLACTAGRLLRGRIVREESSRTPVAIWVSRTREFPMFAGEPGADGRFTVALDTGEYVVMARGLGGRRWLLDGEDTKKLKVDDRGNEPLDLVTKVGSGWRGRLVDEHGAGMKGFVVGGGTGRLAVDSDGRFELPPVSAKEVAVAWDPEKRHGRMFLFGSGTEEHLVVMEPMGEIHGRIGLPEGHKGAEVEPMLWARLETAGEEGTSKGLARFKIEEDGKFRVAPVPTGLEMRVTATIKGYEARMDDRVELLPGESLNVGILKMHAGQDEAGYGDSKKWDAVVTGRIVDERGKPLSGLRVGVGLTGGGSIGVTDLDGRFELRGLPRGKVTVSTEREGYGTRDFAVNSPQEGVEFKMVPDGWQWYGKPAPELVVDRWVSGKIKGLGELKGKVVLLVLGADMKALGQRDRYQQLQEKYGSRGLVVVVVQRHLPLEGMEAWERGEALAEVSEAVAKSSLAVALDAGRERAPAEMLRDKGGYGATEMTYGMRGYQDALFLLDRKGILRGVVMRGELEKKVEEILGE